MSETPRPYRVEQDAVLLDPCVLFQHFPTRIDYRVPGTKLSDRRSQVAELVIERSFSEVARRFMTRPRGDEGGGRRSVQLWEVIELSVAADGTDLQARYLDDEPDAGRCQANIDLSRPIGYFRWMSAFEPVFVQACREVSLNPKVLPGPTGDWIRAVMRRTFNKAIAWKRLRRSVLAFLRPDPLIYSLSMRVFEDGRPETEGFNWIARHVRELSLAGIERPRLLPFLQIVSRIERGSPLENFERIMKDAGITPSARRKLERWGWAPFSQATEFGLTGNCEATIAQYANLLDRLQVMDEPPVMFTELVARGVGFSAPDWYLRSLLLEIQRLEDDYPDDPYPVEFEDTMKWLASRPPEPDRNQKRAAWEWIASQSWKFKLATDAETIKPWSVPCESFTQGFHVVVPLRNVAELYEEALVMRNCLDTLADDCAAGKLAVFSIRDQSSNRRLACFSMAKVETPAFWQLLQVSGKANAEVGAELNTVAMATVEICNRRIDGGRW